MLQSSYHVRCPETEGLAEWKGTKEYWEKSRKLGGWRISAGTRPGRPGREVAGYTGESRSCQGGIDEKGQDREGGCLT